MRITLSVVLPATLAFSIAAQETPRFVVREAPLIQMPGVAVREHSQQHAVDSNSPLHWDGSTLYLFNSYLHPWRTSGPDIEHLSNRISTTLGKTNDTRPLWIEATYKDDDGTLYGAYHFEPHTVCFSNSHLPTAPRIGWLRSNDNGATWEDLGFIIAADPCRIRCDTQSPWDAGGTGDFVFLPDRKKEFFYFYGTSYDPEFAEQGVFAARMPYSDRNNPTGKVMKWYNGGWSEPGWKGHITPAFPATRDYHTKDGSMFWGPSIHWNTWLNLYVMVLNHARDTELTNDGIFISFGKDLAQPLGWSKPVRLIDREMILDAAAGSVVKGKMLVPPGPYYGELRESPRRPGVAIADTTSSGWYPQIIGLATGETDKLCGRVGRIFLTGKSRLEIIFLRPGERQP